MHNTTERYKTKDQFRTAHFMSSNQLTFHGLVVPRLPVSCARFTCEVFVVYSLATEMPLSFSVSFTS